MTNKKTSISSGAKKKSEQKKPTIKDEATKKSSKTNIELKLSMAFAGIAMLANVFIYFFAILPTYEVIDGEVTGGLGDTLDKSERVTEILTPVVFVALAVSIVFLTVGIYKYAKSKSKAKSRIDSSKNS